MDRLASQFDRLDPKHAAEAAMLSAWIAKTYRADRPTAIVVVCTGNSRRSVFGSVMGNVAAAYYDLPQVQFTSGGTEPSQVNARTLASLESVGFDVEKSGRNAPGSDSRHTNVIYRISWGEPAAAKRSGYLEEFSKRYDDPSNPRNGFAAIMVCDEADGACPSVRGAACRVSLPFADPKQFDNTPEEAAKYAERRDDIGRLMLFILSEARKKLADNKK
jgi:arsenate reductase